MNIELYFDFFCETLCLYGEITLLSIIEVDTNVKSTDKTCGRNQSIIKEILKLKIFFE